MRTKLEDFYEQKLYELLQDAIKERDGWAQDRTYQLICGAAQLSCPHEQIPETGTDIMKLREAEAARFPSVTPPAQLGLTQQSINTPKSNFKEHVVNDPETGTSFRITFPKNSKYFIERELNELKAYFRPSEEKK
jgi:hypothetical protein